MYLRNSALLSRIAAVFLLALLLCDIGAGAAYAPQTAAVSFSTYSVQKRYYNDVGGYIELNLELPFLTGEYHGITKINQYFADKEEYFHNDLPFEFITYEETRGVMWEGRRSGHYRSAYYRQEALFGNIMSISADLNGGHGGVGWAGIEGNTFDLNTGKKLGLTDIFSTNHVTTINIIYDLISKILADNINKYLEAGYPSPYWFDNVYEGNGYDTIRERFDPENFYLTFDSLVVFYEKYALADGASGPQAIRIPYEAIIDTLSSAIKGFVTFPTSVQTEPSFEAVSEYTNSFFEHFGMQLLLSNEPAGKEIIDDNWEWRYYCYDDEIPVFAVGTVLACEYGNSLKQMQIRAYNNNKPLSDWSNEVTLTDEMANQYVIVRLPTFNQDFEWIIKVENTTGEDSLIPDSDNGAITDINENEETVEADEVDQSSDNAELSTDIEAENANGDVAEVENATKSEREENGEVLTVHPDLVSGSKSFLDKFAIFLAGLGTGATMVCAGGLIYRAIKRRLHKKTVMR